nr:reverse transcriptase domain-containing protein [Tanacetum cinerariifolium]
MYHSGVFASLAWNSQIHQRPPHKYVAESDPEEDPEEYEDEETKDGSVDYPMDGEDDEDYDNSDLSGDDADDDKEDEEDKEAEEEHLALANSAIVIPTDELVSPPEGTEPVVPPPSTDTTTTRARITVRLHAAISFPPEAEVERLLAIPTPSPSPFTSLSPPSAGERLARLASTQALIDAVTAAIPPPPLYIPPPVDRRDDIPEIEMPPRKRLCFCTIGSRYEIKESSTARLARDRGIDYGFVSTVDAEARRRGIGEVRYGIRDTWVDPTETVPEIAPMTVGEVNTTVTELAELHEHDTQDLYALLKDAHDIRTHISQRVTMDSQRVDLLMKDKIAHQETIQIMEEDAYAAREAWAHSIGLSQTVHSELQTHQDGCAIENEVKFATYTLLDVALTWWNGQIRSLGPDAYSMTWEVLKKKMTNKYCLQGEIKKLEIELWNLKVKENDVPAYTERHFKMDCPKLKNKDGGNANAQGWMYAVGNAKRKGNAERKRNASRDPDSNVVTGTFLLNNHYASVLFDTGADRSFISTAFSSLIDIVPTSLGNSYDVELADGKIVGVDTIMRGCTLNFLNHPFNAPTEGYEDAIVIPEITANNFELKHGLINLIKNKQFFGHDKEDLHAHICYFNKIPSTMRDPNVPSSSIKLMLFPFSLEGAARIWLEKEPPRPILTWDDLVSKFINQFFPPSKTTNLRNEITRFQQRFDESFYEAWDRFNDLFRACPHHGFSELHQLDTFYNALNSKSKVRQSRAKAVVAKVSTSSSTPAVSSEVVELKDLVRALLLDKKNQSSAPVSSSTPAPVKAVEPHCVTCGVSAPMPNLKYSIPYPSRRDNERRCDQANEEIEKFYEICKDMSFEISFTDALILMPKFASTLKALIGNKEKLSEMARNPMNEHCSAVILNKLPRKLGDPGKFLIPCEFPRMDECLALADLGASINIMPLSVWEALSLPKLTPMCMTLELADRSVSKPVGIAKDVSFKVGVFYFPADFVVVDFEPDPRVPLILGRCFLKIGRTLIDVHKGELTLHIRNEATTYNLDQTVRYSANYNQITSNKIDVIEMAYEEYSQEVLGFFDVTTSGNPTPHDDPIVSTTDFLLFEEADAFLGLEDDPISQKINPFYYDPEGDILLLEAILNSEPLPPLPNHEQYMPSFKKELKVCEAKTVKSSVDKPPEVELNDLPLHLEYAFLEYDNKFPVIIAKELGEEEKSALIKVLKSHKRAIAWNLSGIQGINPEFCTHKIPMEKDYKIAVQHQRRVNPKIHDVIKKETIEVFMDDFSVFGNSFENCLSHLDKMLQMCEDTNLSLNWEKSHFMVKEGIVLGHKISKKWIEVDRAKVNVIAKLPHPTTVKGVRNFLGHAGFYRRFIKDFSKISRPMTHLLEKNIPFIFSEDCIKAFQTLKKKLTEAPILIAPNWDLPFELMCDASDFAICAVLEQCHEKHFKPIHYASKTMNDAETNYTTIEKEMLAVVYEKIPIVSDYEQKHSAYGSFRP